MPFMSAKKFYITTAIDYVNSLPHIGTAYEKIGADVLARFKRLQGFEVHFQMGNDEHSVNVQKAAKAKNQTPKQYCDTMRREFETIWCKLHLSYDNFIQTSDPHHEQGVQKLFEILFKNGDIYKAPYEGWYCESCEAFYTEKDLAGGVCPNHKTKPRWLQEENYFFKLSKYQKKIEQLIKKHPEFILPAPRRNEILKLLEGGLQDVSVSRSSCDWGIPLPMDPQHVVYVWFDALINYITAIGFGWEDKKFKKFWPADVHVIGKDITRFHCVIWPAMLMAAKLPLPKTIFGHGFVYLKGEKMSKTVGNMVTPMEIVHQYGADALRYYLLRASSFGSDSDFTWDDFIRRYNGDLANGLGNLVARTLGMIEQYLEGTLKPLKKKGPLIKTLNGLAKRVEGALDTKNGDIEFHQALGAIWEGITAIDQYINDHQPWKMKERAKLEEVLCTAAEGIRIIATLLQPFLPSTAEKILKQLGSKKIQKGEALFPRIESKNESTSVREHERTKQEIKMDTINIQDFAKLDLRVAQILTAEKIEGADKLLKLQIDLGTEQRQIVAGIALHYPPEELIGKKIIVVTNLEPAKIRGVESNGMLLAASTPETLSIITPARDIPVGARVK